MYTTNEEAKTERRFMMLSGALFAVAIAAVVVIAKNEAQRTAALIESGHTVLSTPWGNVVIPPK